MPSVKFWAYVRMMPALRARDAIHRVNELLYAAGSMTKSNADKFIFDLQQKAVISSLETPKAYRPKSMAELQMLAGSSTKVVS